MSSPKWLIPRGKFGGFYSFESNIVQCWSLQRWVREGPSEHGVLALRMPFRGETAQWLKVSQLLIFTNLEVQTILPFTEEK